MVSMLERFNLHEKAGLRDNLAAVLMALLALPLWLKAGGVYGAAALALACLSFIRTHHLVERIRAAERQKCRLDQELIQSQKLASIGVFASGIAHEINNPIAIIGQEAQWIKHVMKGLDPQVCKGLPEMEDSLQEVLNQVNRCREITHKLLDFARKKDPLIQAADLNRLVDDMARLVEREAVSRNIKILRNYQPELPPLFTDPPLMRQVVLNLLNNAMQAVDRDGAVTVATRMSEKGFEVRVSDTGCGIPAEDLNRIFDPFFTTKPQGKGTGLGLSICHGIVTKLGGSIAVESEKGEGATFTIHLPEDNESHVCKSQSADSR
ncbi:MAG: sensor histidine kinase [Acidobacteriota bacterium]